MLRKDDLRINQRVRFLKDFKDPLLNPPRGLPPQQAVFSIPLSKSVKKGDIGTVKRISELSVIIATDPGDVIIRFSSTEPFPEDLLEEIE